MSSAGPKPLPSTLRLPNSPAELGYLAGLMDGEGTIWVGPPKRRSKQAHIEIHIANSDPRIIEWLGAMGGRVRWTFPLRATRPCGLWAIDRLADYALLCQALLPYLRIKRENAKWALAVVFRRLQERYA